MPFLLNDTKLGDWLFTVMLIKMNKYFDIWYQYDDIHISYINNTNASNENFQQRHGKGNIEI